MTDILRHLMNISWLILICVWVSLTVSWTIDWTIEKIQFQEILKNCSQIEFNVIKQKDVGGKVMLYKGIFFSCEQENEE